jgi:hypothetical protein
MTSVSNRLIVKLPDVDALFSLVGDQDDVMVEAVLLLTCIADGPDNARHVV